MKKPSKLSNSFYSSFRSFNRDYKGDWLSYMGQPMLYDGGLFVTRNKEDADIAYKQWVAVKTIPPSA